MKRFLVDYVKPYYKKILLVLIFVIVQVYFQVSILSMTKDIINNGIYHSDLNFILNAGIIMIILTIFYGISMIITSYLSSYLSASVTCDVREDLFKKITSLSPLDFKHFGSSTLMTRATADTTRIQIFMINFLRNAMLIPIVVIALIIAAAQISLELCGILILAFVITILFLVIKSRQSLELFENVQNKLDKLNLLLKEKIEGVRSIRAFGKQDYEINKFKGINEEYNDESLNAAYKLYYLTPAGLIIMNLAVLVIYFLGSVELQVRMISIADLILFCQYVTYFISCLAIVPFIVTTLPKTLVSTSRIEEVLYYDETVKNMPLDDVAIEEEYGLIEFKNVIFGYDGAKDVITDINLSVKPNTTKAFIGPTGSGKSTIIFLLNRFYDPTFGEILYKGRNIKELDIHDLRNDISYCSQKTMVLHDTVYSNITMGNDKISREKARECCNLTLFSEVLDNLPQGLDSIMAQDGMNVSGGQKQRLSLARTIAKDAKIYIFDDCFSALDAKTEAIVRKNIKEYLKGKTIFMVAQKINTIKDAENIIVLDKGRIVDQGTHEYLLENCVLYKEMYKTQSYVNKGEL